MTRPERASLTSGAMAPTQVSQVVVAVAAVAAATLWLVSWERRRRRRRQPVEQPYELVVIGRGLVGSAAAKHAAAALGPGRVALVGPDEAAADPTVFSCHADEGRITRRLDVDFTWGTLASRSIARYPDIERESGVRFHSPVGYLAVAQPSTGGGYLKRLRATASKLGLGPGCRSLGTAELGAAFPYLSLGAGASGVHELGDQTGAGHVSARRLVQAQGVVFRKRGGVVVDATAERVVVEDGGSCCVVTLADATTVRARRVLVATNAFTNCRPLLPAPLHLRNTTQTTVRAVLSEPQQAAFRGMPAVVVKFGDGNNHSMDGCYLLPPIAYPNGEVAVKIGHGSLFEEDLRSEADLLAWYRGVGRDEQDKGAVEALTAALRGLLPAVGGDRSTRFVHDRCVIPKTAHGFPYIDRRLDDDGAVGPVGCAVGCCGYSAKSSDEIGRIAARMMLADPADGDRYGAWADGLGADTFRAVRATKAETGAEWRVASGE